MAKVSPPTTGDASHVAVRGASLLISLQLISRLSTFIANQVLLRYLTAQLLGVATQLEVYYLSVLFFARESLRVAIQRQNGDTGAATDKKEDDPERAVARESQSVVNLGYLALFLGVFVAAGLGWTYLAYVDEVTLRVPNLALALKLYGLASVLELLSEPCFVLMQMRFQYGVRAAAESMATFARCAVTFGIAVWASRKSLDLGVLPFAVGQLSYGALLLVVYAWSGVRLASQNGFSLLPQTIRAGNKAQYWLSYFYRPTISLASSMMAQSIVKHILTQGDTFLVSILSTSTAQGIYALANNYGGLLARLVFQPIEESSRSYFSRLLSSGQEVKSKEGQPTPQRASAEKASRDLHVLVKLYVLLSAVIVAIGPVAAPALLSLVAGRRWTTDGAGEVLATYCYYVPLLAINGVTESFVASVATEAEVHRQSAWMGAFSLAFGAAGFVFLRILNLGAVGLVYANCINMLSRIIWSTSFVKGYFGRLGIPFELLSLQPHLVSTLTCLATPHFIRRVLLAPSPVSNQNSFMDVVKIGLAAIPPVLIILVAERAILVQCFNYIRGRSAS